MQFKRKSTIWICNCIVVLDGPIQRMDPLTNLQVAVKNNIDVFYFSCVVPMYVFFVEAGQMGTYFFITLYSMNCFWAMLFHRLH